MNKLKTSCFCCVFLCTSICSFAQTDMDGIMMNKKQFCRAQLTCITGVPNFPSYISGHSSFSSAAAIILGHILPANASKYEAMSEEAAKSRFISGIHTQMDCDSGAVAGHNVGMFAIQRAITDGAE